MFCFCLDLPQMSANVPSMMLKGTVNQMHDFKAVYKQNVRMAKAIKGRKKKSLGLNKCKGSFYRET